MGGAGKPEGSGIIDDVGVDVPDADTGNGPKLGF